jgi:hypothetical protein
MFHNLKIRVKMQAKEMPIHQESKLSEIKFAKVLLKCAVINDAQVQPRPNGLDDSPKNHINHGWLGLCGANIIKAFECFLKLNGSVRAF